MAARERAARAGQKAQAAASNPYLRRIIEDQQLRETLWAAFDASKSAYQRLQNGKSPAKSLMDDKKLQRELKSAVDALRDASSVLKNGAKQKKSRRTGRKLLMVLVAAGLAVALSEGLRGKVLDLLFGAEEEFEYSSVTEPNSAPEKVAV